MSRLLFILSCLGIVMLLFYTWCNHGIPLGFDHGAYRHFVHTLISSGDIRNLPLYTQQQFEPFSGAFYYTILRGIPENLLFSWGYVGLISLTGMTIFILGKKSDSYTLGSYVGMLLFIFSVSQYTNFWWSFGKQMFATLFLLLLIRYSRKAFVSILFLTACIALHRLTGFIAVVYLLVNCLFEKKCSKTIILVGILVGLITYIPTISAQTLPYLGTSIHNYIFLSGSYGTGLDDLTFWACEIPVLFLSAYTLYALLQKRKNHLRKDIIILAILTVFMVLSHSIAHTRLESFVDLALIVFIATSRVQFNKKILVSTIILQIMIWIGFTLHLHASFVDPEENTIIRNIAETAPKDATLVTLTGAYMSMMTGYTDHEIYSTYQGVSNDLLSSESMVKMRNDRGELCKNLDLLPKQVFVFVGSKEKFTSTIDNPCLIELKKWDNNARLLYFASK